MKKIPLTQGQFALVDDWNYDWLMQWKWCAKKDYNTFYAFRGSYNPKTKKQTPVYMHEVIMKTPKGMLTDHKDHNGCNNQEYNLRICTDQQNAMNRQKEKGCSSPFKGIGWHKRARKWVARIVINKKQVHLGCFDSEVEAAQAYNKAAKEIHGEFAKPNLIKNKALML